MSWFQNQIKRRPKIDQRLISAVIFFVSATYLLLINRHGAFLDTQVYRTAGKQILQGTNPYLQGFRSGPFGAVFIYILSSFGPVNIVEITFGILNIAGILLFAKVLLETKKGPISIFFATIVIWSSPTREMLLNHQISGICLGLVAISFMISKKTSYSKLNILIAATSLALSLDLKPQLVVPFVIYGIFKLKRYKILVHMVSIYLFVNLLASLLTNSFLLKEQFMVITEISDIQKVSKWQDISNLWTLSDYFIPNYQFWRTMSLIFTVGILISIPYVLNRLGSNAALFLASCFPVFSIYCHTYDLIPLAVITLHFCQKYFQNFVDLLSILVILIPLKSFDPQNIAFLLLVAIAVLRVKETKADFAKMIVFKAVPAFLCYFGIAAYFTSLNHSSQIINARIVVYIFIMCLTAMMLNASARRAMISR